MSKQLKFKGVWGELESKKGFQRLSEEFSFLFMLLMTTKFVKNGHILGKIFFIILKNVLKQTQNSFKTKSQPQ